MGSCSEEVQMFFKNLSKSQTMAATFAGPFYTECCRVITVTDEAAFTPGHVPDLPTADQDPEPPEVHPVFRRLAVELHRAPRTATKAMLNNGLYVYVCLEDIRDSIEVGPALIWDASKSHESGHIDEAVGKHEIIIDARITTKFGKGLGILDRRQTEQPLYLSHPKRITRTDVKSIFGPVPAGPPPIGLAVILWQNESSIEQQNDLKPGKSLSL
ncbi:uncharacterized protein B0J16DRAFT_378714 [Fusarium flagelliforme]|uniref:uncharacterized protein n=1 Tax=Fusarium flagelliforme TaxID=2675880 RepID=UPI001E8E0794|nr:uncharacterized protein B0J16DRAFT_378714 [Fusarium flagelliforme]KAH7198279.1 hypothetical protein B0J16DRAFT_378714 [Fusarium flagelliforme]